MISNTCGKLISGEGKLLRNGHSFSFMSNLWSSYNNKTSKVVVLLTHPNPLPYQNRLANHLPGEALSLANDISK